MYWHHLKTILWLQNRLWRNALKRQGKISLALGIAFSAIVVLAGVVGFFLALTMGTLGLSELNEDHLRLIWFGTLAAFCIVWMIGVATDVQRTDAMSTEKLLHLPITIKAAVFVNYLSSYRNFVFAFFLPPMVGLAIAQVIVYGPRMLIVFPLLISFIVMITSVTFQLRGWLATLMVNKRRRRLIMSLMMFFIIGCTQIPNLVNLVWLRQQSGGQQQSFEESIEAYEQLSRELQAGTISADEFKQRSEQFEEARKKAEQIKNEKRAQAFRSMAQSGGQIIRWLPPFWLADGTASARTGILWPACLQTIAGLLISGASLSRSYRSTLRFYRGEFTAGSKRSKLKAEKPPAPPPIRSDGTVKPILADRTLPWVSDSAASVTMTTFLSMIRAPEARMAFGAGILMLIVFSGLAFGGGMNLPMFARPLPSLVMVMMVSFSLLQLSGNMFGFDRHGFRLFVMAPISKRDVLLGKNLALAPLVVGLGVVFMAVLQFVQPIRVTHVLANLVQFVSIFFISCLGTNLMSILAPIKVSAGAFRKQNPGLLAALKQMLLSLLLPLGFMPLAIPWGIDAALTEYGWNPYRIPVYLILAGLLLIFVIWLYAKVVEAQGKLLESRQQKILAIVASDIQ